MRLPRDPNMEPNVQLSLAWINALLRRLKTLFRQAAAADAEIETSLTTRRVMSED